MVDPSGGKGPSRSDGGRGDGRAQSFALEGITAGIIVLSTVIFAIQATAVTPLSVSTASQHVENQQGQLADTLLSQTVENGTLRAAVLYWNPNTQTFVNASGNGYVGRTPDTAFGNQLERVFSDEQIAVNVYVGYQGEDRAKERRLIYQGTPSDNAVSASERVLLTDNDNLTGPYADRTLNGSNATSNFYAPDISPNTPVYNVVEVRIVVWEL